MGHADAAVEEEERLRTTGGPDLSPTGSRMGSVLWPLQTVSTKIININFHFQLFFSLISRLASNLANPPPPARGYESESAVDRGRGFPPPVFLLACHWLLYSPPWPTKHATTELRIISPHPEIRRPWADLIEYRFEPCPPLSHRIPGLQQGDACERFPRYGVSLSAFCCRRR